jgi:ADP-ribosylglycohydrolase
MELRERLAGGVWGQLVGDAMGVPYEFRGPDQIGRVTFGATGSHGQPAGTWSDDGAMMLALLDSLLQAGFDPEDQAARYVAWRRNGHYTPDGRVFDIGGTTSAALARFEAGAAAESAGGRGEHDNGNGSLMRILPLALVGRELPDAELVTRAHRASAVTHGHPRAQAACALYLLVARALLAGKAPEVAMAEASGTLHSLYADSPAPDHAEALGFLEAWPDRSGRGYVVDSFWSAWEAFSGADSYARTVERAIAYGHDTDTTACIAGGLAGVRWGLTGIPQEWREGMRGKEVVEPLVERLLATT